MNLVSFAKEYKRVFPNEIQPTPFLLSVLESSDYITLKSKYNLFYVVERSNMYLVVAHWCLANADYTRLENIKALKEVLKLIRGLSKPVVISNLNTAYYKVTKPTHLKGIREFK